MAPRNSQIGIALTTDDYKKGYSSSSLEKFQVEDIETGQITNLKYGASLELERYLNNDLNLNFDLFPKAPRRQKFRLFRASRLRDGATSEKGNNSDNAHSTPTDDELPPPDRGAEAWLFLAGCFVLEAVVFGKPRLCVPSFMRFL